MSVHRLTQTALAKQLGVTQPTIAQILSGDRPGTKHLPRIAEAIGATVEWLTTGTGPKPSWAYADMSAAITRRPPEHLAPANRVRESATTYDSGHSELAETNALLRELINRLSGMEERLSRLETRPATGVHRRKTAG